MKSFYLLELSVLPGGARKGLFFVYPRLDLIRQILDLDLMIDFEEGLGLLYGYGQAVNLITFINGQEAQRLNLLPFITVSGPGSISFSLDEEANPVGVDREVVCTEKFTLSAQVQVNWEAIPVLPLTGELVRRGDKVTASHIYGSDEVELEYGYNDLECGEGGDGYFAYLEGKGIATADF
ncbi:MAG: hypothetical protein K1Y36_19135 [Blastocatellia bacterium]|nr:hypothetical protein [Blastocatellia bacterium]